MTQLMKRDSDTGQFTPVDPDEYVEDYVNENGSFFQRLLF